MLLHPNFYILWDKLHTALAQMRQNYYILIQPPLYLLRASKDSLEIQR